MNQPNLVFALSLTVILLGYLLKRIKLLTEKDGGTISKIILNITLPAVILQTIPTARLVPSLSFLPVAAILHACILCGVILFIKRRKAAQDKAIYAMGVIGFNNGMFAYPIIEGIFGITGLQYLALFDIGSGLSVFGLSYMTAAYFAAKRSSREFKMTPRIFISMILGSIPFVSYIIALLLNLARIEITGFSGTLLAVPAQANMLLVLLLIGLHLEFSFKGADIQKILLIFGIRYGIGIVLSLVIIASPIANETLKSVLSLLFILPVSMAILPYSAKFDFDGNTGGVLVNFSIIISFIIMWGMINLV